jgi:RNA polymerase sigma factor (sigma-70 family)
VLTTRQFVFDTVYHPAETPLLAAARSRGVPAANGLGMLVHQAALAFTIWTGEPAPSLDQQLLSKQRFECFADYVRKLPPKYRAVLVLSELEELPDKEIAEILELSLGAVKIRLHRGRRLLLHELKGHCKAEDWL